MAEVSSPRILPVPEGLVGERIDVGLSRMLGLSRSQCASLVEEGRVLVDGETGLPLARRTYRELATVMVDQWLASPGHRENLMSRQVSVLGCGMRFARVATGLELVHAVQVFMDP